MKVAKLKCGTSFDLYENKAILESALEQNITLNYSCLTGQCEACKIRVVSGETVEFRKEIGLLDEERSKGFILSCCRFALSNIELDGENLPEFTNLKKARTPAKILKLEKQSEDLAIISLRLHPSCNFNFIPGQYVNLSYGDITRSYSIMDYDTEDKRLKLFIRYYESGMMSHYFMNNAKEGDLLRIYGPLGTFSLRDISNDSKFVFFATGTGIAPFFSIIKYLESIKSNKQIFLFWGNRYKSDFIELPETNYIDLTVHKSLSREKGTGYFNGYIQDDFQLNFQTIDSIEPYICGSESMIECVKEKLILMGFDGTIHIDKFLPFQS